MSTSRLRATGFAKAALRVVTAIMMLLGAAGPAPAQVKAGRARLQDEDKRIAPGAGAVKVDRAAAVARLRETVPDAEVTFDPVTGAPNFIRNASGFLTGADAGRGAVPPAQPANGNQPLAGAELATRAFLDRHPGLFGHGAAGLNAARVRRGFVTPHNRVRTIVWQQELEGLPVCDAVFIAHSTENNELVSLSSQFIADPERAAGAAGAGRARLAGAPPITLEQAVVRAASELGDLVEEADVRRLPANAPGQAMQGMGRQKLSIARLPGDNYGHLTWLPTAPDRLRLCWEVVLVSRIHRETFRILVDAQTGNVWMRQSLTAYDATPTFRVYTSDSPSPFSPGHSVPLTNQPPLASRVVVATNSLNANASPSGWIRDGDRETRGNNVEAHTDLNDDDVPDLPRPNGGPNRVFDFPQDLTQPPSTYASASVVQLFYWCNWMHDQLYELGFTEAAGNFQVDNFGRGGEGGDPVQADAQDGGGVNNANMSTLPDGIAPRMQMYLFTESMPARDGALDAEVILHEYTHGLSNRRVGGGIGISRLQSAGMGEGWSDFYGLALLSEPGDDLDGAYAAGGYLAHLLGGLRENYYFGIRRYPYSTDLTKNPLTFKDIDPTQAIPHTGVPRNPLDGAFSPIFASEEHNQGEVWCSMLWEVRANLIRKHGFATGNRLALQLVTDGMNLSPPNPNFVQARDAIILADRVNNFGANQKELWAGFAKRGLGASASSPASSTTTGVREAFDPADPLSVRPSVDWIVTRRGLDGFDGALRTYTVSNVGPAAVEWSAHYSRSWLQVMPASGALAPRAVQQVTATLANAALGLPGGTHVQTILFSNSVSHVVQPRIVTAQVSTADFLTEIFAPGENDLAFQTLTFTPDDSPGGYAVCRTSAAAFLTNPNGGVAVPLVDEAASQVRLSGGAEVSLFGFRTNVFFIGSNGYLTIGSAESNTVSSAFSHFSRKRISALARDLDPSAGGSVSWRQLSNLVAVTFLDVPNWLGSATNSFQVEWFFDGRIRLTYLRIATDGLVGLSDGNGAPAPFIESDFSAYPGCNAPALRLVMPSAAIEGTPDLMAAVQLSAVPGASVLVTLAGTDPTELSLPTQVTVPAGETNVSFAVGVPDDSDLDGPQPILVTASANGYRPARAMVEVVDNESTMLRVELPSTAIEGMGAITGRVELAQVPSAGVIVKLSSSHTNKLTVPASVVVPAGVNVVTWTATVTDDIRLDGPQTVVVKAQVPNWDEAQATVEVRDNESTNLVVEVPSRMREGDGRVLSAGTVRLGGILEQELVVALSSSDSSELTVPAEIVIPPGLLEAQFDLTIIDDVEVDGSQVVEVTASTPHLASGTGRVEVLDGETPFPPAFPFPPHRGNNVTVTADLSWSGGEYDELSANGGFEEGTFRGWTQRPSFYGRFSINTATNLPSGGTEIVVPLEGTFSAVATQIGPGRHELLQTIVLPTTRPELFLRWSDRVHNYFGAYGASQEYRVEIRTTNDVVLAVAHRTATGDALAGEWTSRQFDLSAHAGRTIRVAFVVNPGYARLEVHIDSVSLSARQPGGTEFEVFFGRNPQPGAPERLGTTTNTAWTLPDLEPSTTYYWQVNASTLGRVAGPVWQFTTAGLDHFVWDRVASPQRSGHAIPVRLFARDARGSVVSNFTGSVGLSAHAGTATSLLFGDDFESGNFAEWERNSDYGTWTITNSPVAAGRFSLSLLGGRQAHRDGISHLLPSLKPDALSFYVRTLRADARGGYLTLGTGPAVEQLGVYFYMGPDGMGIYEDASQGHRIPYQPGRWYHIELFFSWNRHTVDYWVDGVLQARDVPFRRSDIPHFSQIYLYNFDYTQSWWDDIRFTQTNHPVTLATVPERAGPFVEGSWQGEVMLSGTDRSVSLRADDGAGHVAASDVFELLQDNTLTAWITQEPEPASLLSPFSCTVHVFNTGPAAVSDVVVSNALPVSVTLVSFSSTAGQCTAEGGFIRCELGSLAGGARAEMTALLNATNYGRFTNSAVLLANSAAQSPSSNSTRIVITVAPPLLSVEDVTIVEGNFGRRDAVFPLTLSASNPLPVVIRYATSNATAVAGTDFIPADGIIVIAPGVTQQFVRIPVLGDQVREPNELFTLHLRSASNASLGKAHGNGIILDDDSIATATLPFVENWESGTVRPFWLASGSGAYRAGLSRSNQPHAGAFHMLMDNGQDNGTNARSELTLTVNLAGTTNVALRFWARGSFFNVADDPPPAPFLGSADFDGVAVSSDGVTWYEVQSLRSLPTFYTEFIVSLDQAVAAQGLAFTSAFRIRFNQVSPYEFPLSGMVLDDISITGDQIKVQPVTFTLTAETCPGVANLVDPGETVTAQFWLTNAGTMPARQLTASLLATGNVVSPSGPQSYGTLVPGGPAESRSFTFTAAGACGGTLTATLELAEAGVVVGRVPFEMPLGRPAFYHYSFAQPGPILIPSNGTAIPFPSALLVSATGLVQSVRVTLDDFSHPLPDQVDIMLRGPGGQTVTLLSDTGGLLPVNHVTLSFDSASTNQLSDNGQIFSGVYNPTNHGSPDAYPAPAPGPPYGASLDVFRDSNPNGAWELFVLDDTLRDGGSLGGWSIEIDTRQIECCGSRPSADLTAFVDTSPRFINLGESTTFTATAYNRGPDTATGVVLSNALPSGVTFLSVTSNIGSCTFEAGLIRCAIGTLTSNELANVMWTIRGDAAGVLTHTISATQTTHEIAPADNDVSAVVSVLPPVVSIQATSGTEAPGNTATVRFVVSTSASSRTSQVSFATADLTAIAAVDYQPTNGVLVFLPGETSKTINVRILDDLLDEPTEELFLSFFNPVNLSLVSSRSQAGILDNDNAPTLTISDASVVEGDVGLVQAQFRVQVSPASGQSIGVNFATANGGAIAPMDYVNASGQLILVPGETSRILPVMVRGDRLSELNESMFVNLSSPINASLGDSQAMGSILNDDVLPSFSLQRGAVIAENCAPTNGFLDPGETVAMQFRFQNLATGAARASNLVATLLPMGGVLEPGPAQLVGAVAPGAAAVGQFQLTAGTYCGGTLVATFALRDGEMDLGQVNVPLAVGQPVVAFSESFDGVAVPLLPAGWSATVAGTNLAWRTTTTFRDSLPNAVMAGNPSSRSTNDLLSPLVAVGTFQAQLTFRHSFNTESNYDGGFLEISIGQQPFGEFLDAGGRFIQGGYNGSVSSRASWTGNSGGFTSVVGVLPATAEGQTVQFRWRFTSDSSVGGVGWFVDTISLTDGFICCGSPPPILTDITRAGALVTLRWTAVPERQYRIQFKTTLDDVEWANLPGDVMAEGLSATRTDAVLPGQQRFYRVLLLP